MAATRTCSTPEEGADSRPTWEAEAAALGDYLVVGNLGWSPVSGGRGSWEEARRGELEGPTVGPGQDLGTHVVGLKRARGTRPKFCSHFSSHPFQLLLCVYAAPL